MTPRRIDPHARHAAPARLPEDTLHAAPPDEHPTLERVWELLDAAGPATDDTASTDQAWAALADRLALDPGLATQTPRPAARQARTRSASREPFRGARSPRRRWATATLGLAALLLLVLAWPRTVTHTVPFGEQRAVTLPDGSTAHLNSGATLAYARGFDRLPLVAAPTRQVRLDGEAFFDVTPATEHGGRAFVVETFNAQVEVVGTRFNVRAWHSQEERTTVTVEEGIVNVTGSNA
ncbi:MAG: FecR family protein, partial [Bacteroidota bacterium]